MSPETKARVCSLPDCEKQIRSDNRTGRCKPHWYADEEGAAIQRATQAAYRASAHGKATSRRLNLRKHGVTPEWWEKTLAAQGGGCAACGGPANPYFNVDHNHACCTGAYGCAKCVRGILCSQCNMAAGHVRDDVPRLQALIHYLNSHATPCIYVSGGMTGYEDFNFPAFNAAEEQLTAAGYKVENPATKGIIAGWSWTDYLKWDLGVLVSRCYGVAVLPGWPKSKGARLEVTVAEELGMQVASVETWVRQAGDAA